MSSAPWDADRSLSIEAAAIVVTTCFPQVDARALTHIGSGWDFDAFLTTDDWVFRFPRRNDCADQLAAESQVHELVRAALPERIQVPRVELAGMPTAGFPYPFTGHRFIRGHAADVAHPDHLPTLARELGEILGAIHTIPITSARAAGVVEMDADDVGRKEWFDRVLNATNMLRGIDSVIDYAVQWVSDVRSNVLVFDGPLRFIHHDLGPDHVLVDKATGMVTGIIDWTDAILGDPARDFVFPVTWKGWPFANEVLAHYPHAIDSEFGARLRFMSQLLSMAWLADEFKRGTAVEKHIAWVHNAFSPGTVRQITR